MKTAEVSRSVLVCHMSDDDLAGFVLEMDLWINGVWMMQLGSVAFRCAVATSCCGNNRHLEEGYQQTQ